MSNTAHRKGNVFTQQRQDNALRVASQAAGTHAETPADDSETHNEMAGHELQLEEFHPWLEGERQPYRPVILNWSRDGLDAIRFYKEDGKSIFQPMNSHIYDVHSISHKRLSLLYTQHTIAFKGRNLWHLLGALQKKRVIAFIAFHEAYHLEPTDTNAPFIREITCPQGEG